VIRYITSALGVTFVEQMAALLIGSIMMISFYGFFRSEIYNSLILEVKTGVLEDARGALDIMIRDLKNAGSWGDGGGSPPAEIGGTDDPSNDADTVCNRVYDASPGMIHVQMDLNGNGNCNDTNPRESVRYELTGPTSTCPGAYIIRRNGDCLVANVVPAAGGKIFTFFDASGTDLGNAPAREAIKRVRIEFAVQAKNPDPKLAGQINSSLSSSVEFRN
jgi:type II secretory pathway component PulJ